MDQVVGDFDPGKRRIQGLRFEYVALDQLAAEPLEVAGAIGIADQAADLAALVSQRPGQAPTDVARRSGDQHGGGALSRSGLR